MTLLLSSKTGKKPAAFARRDDWRKKIDSLKKAATLALRCCRKKQTD